MLARPTISSASCRPLSHTSAAPVVQRSCRMQRTTTVPAAGAPAAPRTEHPFPNDVLAAVKRYGEHCKATYVLYEQFKDKRDDGDPIALSAHLADVKGKKVFEQANKGSTSTKGPVGWDNSAPEYIIKDNMRGYSSRGNVFVRPTPDVPTEPQAPTIVGAAPVALAGAAKKVTGLFATAKQKIWRALTAPFRKAEPTYMGYIAEGKGADGVEELVIAFRGTSTYSDWIMNLLGGVAAQGLYKDAAGNDIKGKVHQGFHNMVHDWPTNRLGLPACTEAVAATQAIDNALKAYGDNLPPRIICTGHSLGGALATLAAAHIAICHPEDYNAAAAGDATSQDADYAKRRLQVYTFAAPRVGDMAFSSYLTDELGLMAVQVKNVLDPTPDVAPAGASETSKVLGKLWGRTQLARLLNNEDGAAAPAAAAPAGVVMGTTAISPIAAQQPVDAAAEARHNKLRKQLDVYGGVAAEFYASSGDDLGGLEWSSGNMQEGPNQELADECDDLEGLESSTTRKHKTPALAPALLGRAFNFWERMRYRQQLAHTLKTAWCDNPAPEFGCGIFSSADGGKWGGAMHSLEVYLKTIKKWQPKA